MSSNIRINRICQYCGKEFEAKKTTSKTCSDKCAKMLYKQRQKEAKIEKSNEEITLYLLAQLKNEASKHKESLLVYLLLLCGGKSFAVVVVSLAQSPGTHTQIQSLVPHVLFLKLLLILMH